MSISGKTFVLTGTPNNARTRRPTEQELVNRGAYIATKISAVVDYLISGRSDTVKYRQAVKQGITVLTYDELYTMISGAERVRYESEGKEKADKAKVKQQKNQKKAFAQFKNELNSVNSNFVGW